MAFKVLTAVLSLGLALADKGVTDPFAGENGTNETELINLDITPAPTPVPTPVPTRAPTPAPTPAPTSEGDVVVQTTTFDFKVELENPEDFSLEDFKKAMAASMDIDAADIELKDVKFEVKTAYTFTVAITEAQAKQAIAAANSVTEADVKVIVISPGIIDISPGIERRLEEGTERRLAFTSVDAFISVPASDAAKAKAILTSAADGAALASQLSTITGTTVDAPTVVAPVVTVTATTKVSTKGAIAVQPPTVAEFSKQLEIALPGKSFTVKMVSKPVFGTDVVSPTPAPTVEATPAPTEGEEDGASSASVLGALLATTAALGLTGFF
eukprot:TRINITY_DN9773_c0_g3_i1.p1 TRINITY_DN9773_c0_g3~~TRINITY_DN9773_c0_g3_i1.p1  ORF type:complete len:353 (+),score=104.19 TRINITY_DN9773_c0_g3_i1:76-1059(+)